MRRALKSLVVLAVPMLWAACGTPEPADTELEGEADVAGEMAAPAADPAAIEAEVGRVRDAWIAAAEADDAATVAGLYADDAILVAPDGTVAEGRQAIQEMFATDFPQTSNTQITSTDMEAAGDLATDMGEFTQTVQTPDGQEQTVTGRYIVVLRRQADGSWKITQQLAALPMPPEGDQGM